MTQAYNLSQFANTVNSSGQASNSGLQNSSLTVTAGDGMSGGGSVALGSSVTLTNAGVTALTAGTGISVSASTGSVTISNTLSSGVTSVSGGNGITTSGSTSVSVALGVPSGSSVGTYTAGIINSNNTTYAIGSTVAGSSICYASGSLGGGSWYNPFASFPSLSGSLVSMGLSGTWRACATSLSTSGDDGTANSGNLWIRIA
jgi:hypothetical protein